MRRGRVSRRDRRRNKRARRSVDPSSRERSRENLANRKRSNALSRGGCRSARRRTDRVLRDRETKGARTRRRGDREGVMGTVVVFETRYMYIVETPRAERWTMMSAVRRGGRKNCGGARRPVRGSSWKSQVKKKKKRTYTRTVKAVEKKKEVTSGERNRPSVEKQKKKK